MTARYRNHFFGLIVAAGMLCHQRAALASDCFPTLQNYLIATYGEQYAEDTNLAISKRKFGTASFRVVEDKTTGTNHSIALIDESGGKACVRLVTGPTVTLEPSSHDKAGFPTTLISVDQAIPGGAAHEISYRYDSKLQGYVVVLCRELRYQGSRRKESIVDCNTISNY